MAIITEEVGVGSINAGDASVGLGQYILPSNEDVNVADDMSATVEGIIKDSDFDVPKLSEDSDTTAPLLSPNSYTPRKSTALSIEDKSKSGSSPSVDDLNKVIDLIESGPCIDADQIAESTKLSRENVMRCIDYLVAHGQIDKDASRYCGISTVKRMCEQIKGCKECFQK